MKLVMIIMEETTMPMNIPRFHVWRKASPAAFFLLIQALVLAACGQNPAPTTAGVPATATVPQNTSIVLGEAGATTNPTAIPSEAAPTTTENPVPPLSTILVATKIPRLPSTIPQITPTPEPLGVEEIPAAFMSKLIADVQKRTGVAAESILIRKAAAVTWKDGSLDCPKPGMEYAQVLVDGYWVILQVGDKVYDYRTSRTGEFILCG
jgi:hypothetical protein